MFLRKRSARHGWLCCGLFAALFLLAPQSVSAALVAFLPHHNLHELTERSDLIVVGTQEKDNQIIVQQVLKGRYTAKKLTFSARSFCLHCWDVKEPTPKTVVLFLNQRKTIIPGVVANGMFRVGTIGKIKGVFKYHQFINPGNYMLCARETAFASLCQLEDAIEKECESIIERQCLLYRHLGNSKSRLKSQQIFKELRKLVRFGDLAIQEELCDLALSDTPFVYKDDIYGLICEVGDPGAYYLLRILYRQSGCLPVYFPMMGQLGNVRLLPCFERALKMQDQQGKMCVYLVEGFLALRDYCEERKQQQESAKIRATLCRWARTVNAQKKAKSQTVSMVIVLLILMEHKETFDCLKEFSSHQQKQGISSPYFQKTAVYATKNINNYDKNAKWLRSSIERRKRNDNR